MKLYSSLSIIPLLCIVSLPVCGQSPPVVYPVPDALTGGPYEVTVNGAAVPLEKAGEISPVYYARFQCDSDARVEIAIDSREPELAIKPARMFSGESLSPGRAAFRMPEPGTVVLTTGPDRDTIPPLAIIRDKVEAFPFEPAGRKVFDVSHLAGDTMQREALQKTLDDCSTHPGGGVVYFGPGTYYTGALWVGGNTEIYLAPGSLIIGSDDFKDYLPTYKGRKALLLFDKCSNSSIRGYGVIEGRGHVVRMDPRYPDKEKPAVTLMVFLKCRNILIEGVCGRNPAFWNTHILGCDNVTVRGYKALNDWGVYNTDGVNPHASTNVLIEDYFGHCGDDAVAVKTSHQLDIARPCHNVLVRDSIIMCLKTSLKFGTGTEEPISNIRCENIDIINSSRGIGMWMRDGSRISEVTFKNIRMDLYEFPHEPLSGEAIRSFVAPRLGIGRVEHILFENMEVRSPWRSIIQGHPDKIIRGLTFRNCKWTASKRIRNEVPTPMFDISYAENIRFLDNEMHWSHPDSQWWTGFMKTEHTEDILIRNLSELPEQPE